jgi:toxin CcdB
VAQLVIRQFDVFDNPSDRLRNQVPFVVAIQSHFLEALRTTIVAPLFRVEIMPPERGVILPVTFQGEPYALNVALLANIEARMLRRALGKSRRARVGDQAGDRPRADRLLT